MLFIFAICSITNAHQRWGGVGCSQEEDIPSADATPSLTLFFMMGRRTGCLMLLQHPPAQ
jgi:hypothetical protein